MPRMTAEERRYLEDLVPQLREASSGRGEMVTRAAAFLGRSRDWVYRALKEVGYESGRKRRRDAGRRQVAEQEARAVANLMRESARANGKRLQKLETAVEIAQANGLVQTEASLSTWWRALEDHGLHPEQLAQPAPYTELRSLHPNHTWEFDVSLCVLYYLDDGGLAVMDRDRFYKNKPVNSERIKNDRVLRYLAVDHYSGAFYLRYYQRPGEDQDTLFEFLMEAFGERDHPQDPFHGVPFQLVWDAGSANTSRQIQNLLDRLQVRHWAHTPGNPRAKGLVERTHDLVEREFEGRLFLQRIQSLEQLNQAAHTWMRDFNATKIHSRTGTTRYGLWQTIQPDQLRLRPERSLCQELLWAEKARRKVRGNLVIQYAPPGFDSAQYSVAHVPGIYVGDTVRVCINPYRAPNIILLEQDSEGREVTYECEPVERDAAGFDVTAPVIGEEHKTPADTVVDTNRKALAKEAYGADTEQEVRKKRDRKEPAFGGEVDPFGYLEERVGTHYMPRRGTTLDLPQAATPEVRPLGHAEALKRLRNRLGRPLTKAENRAIKQRYPDGVPEGDLEDLVAWLTQDQGGDQAASIAT